MGLQSLSNNRASQMVSSATNMVGGYASGYGSSGYGGCCCCDENDGGLLNDNNLLGLLAAGAAAVALLFTAITMAAATTRRRRKREDLENEDVEETFGIGEVMTDMVMQGRNSWQCGVSVLVK